MKFTLRIYESELKEIEGLVLRYPHIETGGDLFGLWTSRYDPVVQLIIGPGKNCRRTSVSFHQDTDYLQNVGTYVNKSFMLCHIGSWHSHHQLSLYQPSAGDRSTVRNNYPVGLPRYIMVIANILRDSKVVIHPYMFTDQGRRCTEGDVEIIRSASPFRDMGYLLKEINKNAERHVIDGSKRQNSSWGRCQSAYNTQKDNQRVRQPSSPKINRPKSSKKKKDDLIFWYETEEGKSTLNAIMQNIKNNLPETGMIETKVGKDKSKKLKFHHDNRIWSIKIPKNYPKEKGKLRKKRRTLSSFYKDVCEFRFPFDVVEALKLDLSPRHPPRRKIVSLMGYSHNLVVEERANPKEMRRSAWQDGSAQLLHVTHKNQLTHSEPRYNHQPYGSPIPSNTEHQQWYDTDEGMTRFEKIQSQLASLPGREIEVSRGASSHNLCLKFVHGWKKWKITFPANYPRTLPEVTYSDNYQQSYQVHVSGTNVLDIIRKNCNCSKCYRYR